MLKLFRKSNAKCMKAQLEQICSIKIDLSNYPSHNSSKRKEHINIKIKDDSEKILENKNKLNDIYKNVGENISYNLDNLNDMSLFQLKQIIKRLKNVPYSTYSDKESSNKIKFLISVWKRIDYIIIEHAVQVLNEAYDLISVSYNLIMEGNKNLPIEYIEKTKEELEICIENVDFSRTLDIRDSILGAINDMNNILNQSQKNIKGCNNYE